MITAKIFEDGFAQVERAIDQHGWFERLPLVASEPRAHVTREGFTVEIRVKTPCYRTPQTLTGSGETFEEACRKLAEGLDIWQEVLRKR